MKQLSIIILFCITFLSCKKEKSLEENPLDKITIQLRSEVVPVPPKTYSGVFSNYFKMTNIGTDIYIAPPYQNSQPLQNYFIKYNLNSKSYSTLNYDPSICACGYTSKLVNNGTNIFYIANEAKKYNISTNTWSSINYPVAAQNNNGEAGVLSYSNKIYFLGGRTFTNKLKYYDILNDQWYNLANAPYYGELSNMAAIDNKIYALGGYDGIKHTKTLSVFDINNNSWDTLPPIINLIPYTNSSRTNMVSLNERFLVVIDGEEFEPLSLSIFDTYTNQWRNNPIDLNLDYLYPTLLNIEGKIYVASNSNSGELFLTEIVIQNLPS
jgi:hypothetical protein